MLSPTEAQELHELIGVAVEVGDHSGLGRARELAAVLVSDTQGEPMTTTPVRDEDLITGVGSWTPGMAKYRGELREWAEYARYILVQCAERGDTITYSALYDYLLVHMGKTSGPLMWRNWISLVLFDVAQLNRINEEPLLTSMVVFSISRDVSPEGYGHAVLVRYGDSPALPLMHAQIERTKAYRFFAPVGRVQ